MDRNTTIITICIASRKSLSARRAWIEMLMCSHSFTMAAVVALRKESVDRNDLSLNYRLEVLSRSPQGERG